jgi:hypothetical protein
VATSAVVRRDGLNRTVMVCGCDVVARGVVTGARRRASVGCHYVSELRGWGSVVTGGG